MRYFFEYNWQVRDEWMAQCQKLAPEVLYAKRVGGVGSIAYTFFHVAKVEYDWIRELQGQPGYQGKAYEELTEFDGLVQLSQDLRQGLRPFVEGWEDTQEGKILHLREGTESEIYCTYGEVMRHVIAHEIHHMGQLSVWFREMDLAPVSANVIHRGLFINNQHL
ncbi:MAG: DinB family protein [Bacteroidota bacterium]